MSAISWEQNFNSKENLVTVLKLFIPRASRGVDCVACVVGVRPRVGALGQAAIGQQVKNLLVRVILAGIERKCGIK